MQVVEDPAGMEEAPGMVVAVEEAMVVVVAAGVAEGVDLTAALAVEEAATGEDAGVAAASGVEAAVDMGLAAMVAAAGLLSTLPFLRAWAHLHPSMVLTGVLLQSKSVLMFKVWFPLQPFALLKPAVAITLVSTSNRSPGH